MRVLGIDPGIDRLGWAIVDSTNSNDVEYIHAGYITTDAKTDARFRNKEVYDDLQAICKKYDPDLFFVEELYFAQNVTTAMVISEVRGIIKLLSVAYGKEYKEIHPMTLKKMMTGTRRATKNQMRFMVKQIFSFKELPKPDDVADAIAIAYTGTLAHYRKLLCSRMKSFDTLPPHTFRSYKATSMNAVSMSRYNILGLIFSPCGGTSSWT